MNLSNGKNSTWYSFIRENARRYATHVPHGYAYFGKSIVSSYDSLLRDFTSCRERQNMEYEPMTVISPDPPLLIQPSEIYHKHVGMIPNYLGHIPGAIFRCGKTFGADSTDAKNGFKETPTCKSIS